MYKYLESFNQFDAYLSRQAYLTPFLLVPDSDLACWGTFLYSHFFEKSTQKEAPRTGSMDKFWKKPVFNHTKSIQSIQKAFLLILTTDSSH